MRQEYLILTRFKCEKLSAKDFCEKTRIIVTKLRRVIPYIQELYSWGKHEEDWMLINTESNNFCESILSHIEDKKINYENADSNDKSLNLNSKSFKGFRNSYSNKKNGKNKITISISGGGNKGQCMVNIKFSDVDFLSNNYKQQIKNIFNLLCELTSPDNIAFTNENFMLKTFLQPYKFHVGFMTYIKDEIINDFPQKIEKEKFKSGTLFTLSKEIPVHNEEQLVNTAIEIRNLIGSKG